MKRGKVMMQFRLLSIVFIVGVLQVCTASPVVSDAASLFSNDELEIAKNAGVSERNLVKAIESGFTFEQIMKLSHLGVFSPKQNITLEYMTNVCEVVDAEHKTATNYAQAQQTRLEGLIKATNRVPNNVLAIFIRTTICGYISQPETFDTEANSFGLELVTYMEIRHLKMQAQQVSGARRAEVAKDMCCLYENLAQRAYMLPSKLTSLTDEVQNEFDQHWNEFKTANTLKSMENICTFLRAKLPNDECRIAV